MTRVFKAASWLADLAGIGAIVDGVWRVSVPAALIVGGILLMAASTAVDRALERAGS